MKSYFPCPKFHRLNLWTLCVLAWHGVTAAQATFTQELKKDSPVYESASALEDVFIPQKARKLASLTLILRGSESHLWLREGGGLIQPSFLITKWVKFSWQHTIVLCCCIQRKVNWSVFFPARAFNFLIPSSDVWLFDHIEYKMIVNKAFMIWKTFIL